MIVVDNFLPYPTVVRKWALEQQWYTDKEMTELVGRPNTWPGQRTQQITELDTEYSNRVLSNIAGICRNSFDLPGTLEIRSAFQLTTESSGSSWIHVDDNVDVAGVLYLTPNAPINSGTVLYSNEPHMVVDTIGNIYNRLILYRANTYHKSAPYFGTCKYTGRLTQVFFIKGSA